MHSPTKNQHAICKVRSTSCPCKVLMKRQHLNNNNSVDSHVLHSSLSPLECKSILGEVPHSLQHATHVRRGYQLNLRQPYKVGKLRLGSPEK